MNKEEQKKPREVELNIELHKNTPIIIQGTPIHIEGKDYTFNNITIQLSPEFNMFLDGNNNIFTRKLYIKRENVSKNKKIITETYFEGNKIPQNEMQLFNDYDHIFAMDTNYKDYNGNFNIFVPLVNDKRKEQISWDYKFIATDDELLGTVKTSSKQLAEDISKLISEKE